jgi:hypothetical protein
MIALCVMKPGGWFSRGDLARAAGFDLDARGDLVCSLLAGSLATRARNPKAGTGTSTCQEPQCSIDSRRRAKLCAIFAAFWSSSLCRLAPAGGVAKASIGFVLRSAALWLRSAKVPLDPESSPDELGEPLDLEFVAIDANRTFVRRSRKDCCDSATLRRNRIVSGDQTAMAIVGYGVPP